MKENQKDSLTTGSQGQQAQSNQQYNSTKVGTPSPRQGHRDEEEDEPQAGTKQYESKEQRDGKTSPQEAQNRRDEEQRKTQNQSSEQNRTQNGSQQTSEQKKH